jgi:hypothetical protein
LRTTVACAERKLADARALTLAARRGAWLANDAASERAATAFTRVTAAERKLRVAERAVAEAEDAATEERGLTALVTADAIAAEQRATTERTAGRAAANAWCAAEAELEEERIRMCDAQTRHRAEVARLTAERDVATKRAAAAERATVAVGGGTAGGGPGGGPLAGGGEQAPRRARPSPPPSRSTRPPPIALCPGPPRPSLQPRLHPSPEPPLRRSPQPTLRSPLQPPLRPLKEHESRMHRACTRVTVSHPPGLMRLCLGLRFRRRRFPLWRPFRCRCVFGLIKIFSVPMIPFDQPFGALMQLAPAAA